MPYNVRAFCTGAVTPTINSVLACLRQNGFECKATIDNPAELDSPEWESFELFYNAVNGPIVIECNRDDGDESLARAECQEFLAEVAELNDAREEDKDAVIKHLANTRFIVSCQLLSDIDDSGYDANGEFLNYFVEHCGGMIYADGEGFYRHMDMNSLLLAME